MDRSSSCHTPRNFLHFNHENERSFLPGSHLPLFSGKGKQTNSFMKRKNKGSFGPALEK